jgi:hypothetical protein
LSGGASTRSKTSGFATYFFYIIGLPSIRSGILEWGGFNPFKNQWLRHLFFCFQKGYALLTLFFKILH